MDWRVVISPAPVTAWSSTLFLRVASSRASTAEGRRSVLLSDDEASALPKLNLPIMYRLRGPEEEVTKVLSKALSSSCCSKPSGYHGNYIQTRC